MKHPKVFTTSQKQEIIEAFPCAVPKKSEFNGLDI